MLDQPSELATKLTPTELRLLRLRRAGLADKEIATALKLAHGSVRNYFYSINKKCGFLRRSETADKIDKILGVPI